MKCETPYPYRVSGDYKYHSTIKNMSSCFDSVAIPLIGSDDHGGSYTGDFLTDAKRALEESVGKRVKMTFSVYDMERLEGGLQTLLSIEVEK